MPEYAVRDVVSDYGVYENDELKLILNSRRIALQIAELLKEDERTHRELNPIKDYPPYLDRPKPRPAANLPDSMNKILRAKRPNSSKRKP